MVSKKRKTETHHALTDARAYLQHFIEVFDFRLLVLLQRDVVFFKLQILRVKCLQKREKGDFFFLPSTVRPNQTNQMQ